MSAPQPSPMFPKACKHKKVFETWKFRLTPMFSQAMKHEKPTGALLFYKLSQLQPQIYPLMEKPPK